MINYNQYLLQNTAEGIQFEVYGTSPIVIGWAAPVVEDAPAAAPAAAPSAPMPAPTAAKPAPGTAGELKLYNVEERDAAMVMAIVADKLGKPLNELRFISIREVTE